MTVSALLALVFLDQYTKATSTQIIQQTSCKPDGKLQNTPFVQEETKPFKTIQHTLVLLGVSVKEQFHGSAPVVTQFTTVSTAPLL